MQKKKILLGKKIVVVVLQYQKFSERGDLCGPLLYRQTST